MACDGQRGLLVLERSRGAGVPRELWVVRPEVGLMGRLPRLPALPPDARWAIRPARGILTVGRRRYRLRALRAALSPGLLNVDMDGLGKGRFLGRLEGVYMAAVEPSGKVSDVKIQTEQGQGSERR